MENGKKRVLSLLLAIVLAFLLPGCTQAEPVETIRRVEFSYQDPITLRLAMDGAMSKSFQSQVVTLIEDFTALYDNVTIEVEMLPNGPWDYGDNWEQEREELVTLWREQVVEGEGPDLFLWLPASARSNVFPDVNEAMRVGAFADISEFYATDSDLDSDGLVPEVMEAGVVNGARYVLPLRYNYQVVYVEMERLYEAGLTTDSLDAGILQLLNDVTALADPDLANSLTGYGNAHALFHYFTDVLDYDAREVLLQKEQLVDLLQCIQNYEAAFPEQMITPEANLVWFCEGDHWLLEDNCMRMGDFSNIIPETITAKALGKTMGTDLKMYPVAGVEGDKVAYVTACGAVNANCSYPDVAYEFLRLFLLEQTQWEQNVDLSKVNLASEEMIAEQIGYVLGGYPVRTLGSVSAMYQVKRDHYLAAIDAAGEQQNEDLEKYSDNEEFQERVEAISAVEVADFDVPILDDGIDIAWFPVWELSSQLRSIVRSMNDPETGEPTDVDIQNLAEDYLNYLNTYLYGGGMVE